MSWAIEEQGYSQRRARGLIGLETETETDRCASTRDDDARVRVRLRSLAGEFRQFGYRRLLILLCREGLTLNHKTYFRLCREERLSVSTRRVAHELDRIIAGRGKPLMIVSDNGAELASHAILRGQEGRSTGWHDITPASRSRTVSLKV